MGTPSFNGRVEFFRIW